MAKANIPKNFNLSIYDQCASWKATEWANFVTIREIYNYAASVSVEELFDTKKAVSEWLNKDWLKGIEFRVDGTADQNSWKSVNPLNLEQVANIYVSFSDSINEEKESFLTKIEANKLIERASFDLDGFDGIKKFLEDLGKPEDELKVRDQPPSIETDTHLYNQSYDRIRDEHGYMFSHLHAAIDLSAPDEVLIKDFKDYVKQQRQQLNCQSNEKQFSEDDFLKWHKLRLAAYIDLSLWKKVNKSKITNTQLAKALFPEKYRNAVVGEDHIRRTIKPKAMKLLSLKTRNTLQAQARIEESSSRVD